MLEAEEVIDLEIASLGVTLEDDIAPEDGPVEAAVVFAGMALSELIEEYETDEDIMLDAETLSEAAVVVTPVLLTLDIETEVMFVALMILEACGDCPDGDVTVPLVVALEDDNIAGETLAGPVGAEGVPRIGEDVVCDTELEIADDATLEEDCWLVTGKAELAFINVLNIWLADATDGREADG